MLHYVARGERLARGWFPRVTRFDQRLSTEDTDEVLTELAYQHLQELSSPAEGSRRDLASAVMSGDTPYLVGYEVDYSSCGTDPLNYYHIRQILAFWQKRQDVDLPGVDPVLAAMTTFVKAEASCYDTDHVFRLVARGELSFPPRVAAVLHTAQRKIATCLGDVPSWDSVRVRFGPGATTQVKKADASPRAKLGQTFACSKEFLEEADVRLEELLGWVHMTSPDFDWEYAVHGPDTASVAVEIHPGTLNFVPKNAKTRRSVVSEPMLNGLFQLGVGDWMAACLKREGIDISDQTQNQRLAREGSLTGALATLDLSTASDTISRELVFSLLPVDWALMLDTLCTREVSYKGVVRKLRKFSTMGNGFTFALETLIFWGLASACVPASKRHLVSVYGDDIIVPTEYASLLSEVLSCCGFTVNREKSFTSGPFRESCGKDYYSGIDIRPCYIKDRLSGADLFRLHNFYVRTQQPIQASIVLSHIAEPLRIWGPDGYGDGHLLGEWTPLAHRREPKSLPHGVEWGSYAAWRHSSSMSSGWAGWTFDTYLWQGKSSLKTYPGDSVLPAYSVYASHPLVTEEDDERRPSSETPTNNQGERIRSLDRGVVRRAGGNTENSSSVRLNGDRREAPPSVTTYNKQGLLRVDTPGKKGYKRMTIYTLNPA